MNFDGTITLGNVLQVILIFGGLFGAYAKLDKRLALVEQELRHVWKSINGEEEEGA